jgi:CheY-like chemotaxis protein
MGDKITVKSEYGKGSVFTAKIIQKYVDGETIGETVAENLRSFKYSDEKRIMSGKLVRINLSYAKVLVVDDVPTNLDVAAGLMKKYLMQIDCVTSGRTAVERIRSGKPIYNAIFMVHMMPEMDGIQAADAIRAISTDYAKNIPLIALTANAISGTEKLFYEHNFQAFLSKPIDIMLLDSILHKWVRNKELEQAQNRADKKKILQQTTAARKTAIVIL